MTLNVSGDRLPVKQWRKREYVLDLSKEAAMGEGAWNACGGRFYSLDEKGWYRVVFRDDGYVELVRRYDGDQHPAITLAPEHVERLRELLNGAAD